MIARDAIPPRDHIGPLLHRLTGVPLPLLREAIDALDPLERARLDGFAAELADAPACPRGLTDREIAEQAARRRVQDARDRDYQAMRRLYGPPLACCACGGADTVAGDRARA